MSNVSRASVIEELHAARNKALVSKRQLEEEAMADPKHEFWTPGSKAYLLGREYRGELCGLDVYIHSMYDDDFNIEKGLDKIAKRRESERVFFDNSEDDKAWLVGFMRALDTVENSWRKLL